MVSVAARRSGVAYAEGRGLSQRRATALCSTARSSLKYTSRKAAADAAVVARMTELAARYPRFGYRRIQVYLERDGFVMNGKRMHRLWREAKLQLPKKRPRKRIRGRAREEPATPVSSNEVWSYDFVFDHAANGHQLKCLTVVDEGTSEGLAIDVAGSIRSRRVIEVLARLVSERGAPKVLRSDNGPEFVSRALLKWIASEGIESALIEPGKPWQNGLGESFNGKFRDECLSMEWFRNRTDAKIVIEAWRRHYNEVRPHSSLGNLTPAEFKKAISSTRPESAILQV
jgi:putative transposase